MIRRIARLALPLAALAAMTAGGGCASSGASVSDDRVPGFVSLTARGARATVQGDPASVARSTGEVFRVMNIDLIRQRVDDDGGTVEGQAGPDRIFLLMSAEEGNQTEVEVRVRRPADDRWNRRAAVSILKELRRWRSG